MLINILKTYQEKHKIEDVEFFFVEKGSSE